MTPNATPMEIYNVPERLRVLSESHLDYGAELFLGYGDRKSRIFWEAVAVGGPRYPRELLWVGFPGGFACRWVIRTDCIRDGGLQVMFKANLWT